MAWLIPAAIGAQVVDGILNGGGRHRGNNNAALIRMQEEEEERRRCEEEMRRYQQELDQMRQENQENIEKIQREQQETLNRMQMQYAKQSEIQQSNLNEMKQEREKDRKLYQKQMEQHAMEQQQLLQQVNQMREERESQQKKYEEREEKIKKQLDVKIKNLKSLQHQTQKEYDQKMKQIQKINNTKLGKLQKLRDEDLKQHKEKLNQMAKQNESKLNKLKNDELQHKIVHIEQLIITQIEQYLEKREMAQKIFLKYKQDLLRIETEKERLKTFSTEILDRKILNIVLIGITGHGKSTFACRLAGDSSNKCDALNIFHHNDKAVSVTQDIEKYVCKNKWQKDISIVDTPGILDSNGKDFEHANNLVEYLKGCGGVNAFLLVKTRMPPRFDAAFKNVLINLEGLLGPEFWKYVIILLTHTKDVDAVPSAFNQYSNQLRQRVYDELCIKDRDNVKLPCIGVDSFQNYKKPIRKLLDIIPKQRFECNNLISPLQELQIENQNIKNAFLNYKKELDVLKYNILLKKKEIETANNILINNLSNYKPKIIDLSMIEKQDNEFQFDLDDEKSPL